MNEPLTSDTSGEETGGRVHSLLHFVNGILDSIQESGGRRGKSSRASNTIPPLRSPAFEGQQLYAAPSSSRHQAQLAVTTRVCEREALILFSRSPWSD